jgi:endonuclease/exonuclease/phosphatase family metal-dependent hydrolase
MSPLPDKHGRLRVATLNLWGRFAEWPRRRALLEEQLPPLEVDVYFLQEVVCGGGGGDQLAELADSLGYAWTVRVVAENRPHETEDEGVAILSSLPLHTTAVWPLPPSHPPRHRLETSVDRQQQSLRLMTLHAAVSNDDGRDAQIAALADLGAAPLVLGADLNAPPWVVRPRLEGALVDTLDWDEQPTWPVNAEEWAQAWKQKLGERPSRDAEPRRLDYLLCRGVGVAASGTVTLGDATRSASDHRLVWADIDVAGS